MKWILLAIILVLVAVLIGWISFRQSEDKATITIEKKEIKQDAKKAVEKGSDLIKDAKERIKKTNSPKAENKDDSPGPKPDADSERHIDQEIRHRQQPQ